jgi:tetratricopeptide (TPR) repeat protein
VKRVDGQWLRAALLLVPVHRRGLGTLEPYPRSDLARQLLGHAYLQKGMHDAAIDAFRRTAALNGVRDSAHLAYGCAVAGRRAESRQLVEILVASERERYVPPFHIALAWAGLGERDAPFRCGAG